MGLQALWYRLVVPMAVLTTLSFVRSEDISTQRKTAVRDAMQFVWTNYHTRAFGADTMTPIDGNPKERWGRIGCMILDSMDTLWIMNLTSEFEQARQWVHNELTFKHMGEVSVFETIIRALGGLLSAYDLSGDRVFLSKAVELAERMLPAINTTTGRAFYWLDTKTNETSEPASLASTGSYQLEFEYLSHVTEDPKYADIATKLYPYLLQHKEIQLDGLYAREVYTLDDNTPPTSLTLRMSGGCDSFYEYLLKAWILTGEPEDGLTKQMYLAAMDGMEKLLLHTSSSGRIYLGEYDMVTHMSRDQMSHLACFVPGLLALGAERLKTSDPQRSQHHLQLAKGLMEMCFQDLYWKHTSHLSPEYVQGSNLEPPTGDDEDDIPYRLRPETVESLYVMHQLTGDPIYQEWGWQIFTAIETNCRTTFAYAGYRNVTVQIEWSKDPTVRAQQEAKGLKNTMETFFTAETLKYLYLLFDPHNPHVGLDTHVFNTEAHPLSIIRK